MMCKSLKIQDCYTNKSYGFYFDLMLDKPYDFYLDYRLDNLLLLQMMSHAKHCVKTQEDLGLLTLFVLNVILALFQISRVRSANTLFDSLSKSFILMTFYARRVHLCIMSSRIIFQILWFVLAYVLEDWF
jgi:hypothetical protein